MGLSIRDQEVGTIVDWEVEQKNYGTHQGKRIEEIPVEERKQELPREEIKRGIIVKVEKNNRDSVQALWVKFRAKGAPQKIRAGELIRVFPAKSRVAREAYRRIMDIPKYAGSRYSDSNRLAARNVDDELSLTPIREERGLVKPEIGGINEIDDEMKAMDLPDTEE